MLTSDSWDCDAMLGGDAMRYTIIVTAITAAIGLLPFSSGGADAGSQVKISKRDCQRLARKQANASADYRPGVDVRGRKVAGADLNSGKRLKLPNTLSFDISTDLGALTGKSIGKGKIGDAKIGTVKFDINSGNMTFNGQRISGRAQAQLSAKCKQVLSGR